jgi:hypothetical protein
VFARGLCPRSQTGARPSWPCSSQPQRRSLYAVGTWRRVHRMAKAEPSPIMRAMPTHRPSCTSLLRRPSWPLLLLALTITCLAGTGCGDSLWRDILGAAQQTIDDQRSRDDCGARRGLGQFVPDCPLPPLCFTSPCATHDECYITCAAPRNDCDRQFFNDMRDLCLNAYLGVEFGRAQCLSLALVYFTAVSRLGAEFYECEFPDPPAEPGACCTPWRTPVCADVADRLECPFDGIVIPDLTCDEVNTLLGGCPSPPNDHCANALAVCPRTDPTPGLGQCRTMSEGDDDGNAEAATLPAELCSLISQDCADGSPCVPFDGAAFRCTVIADNRLATTDGPEVGAECVGGEPNRFQADAWYEYVAPCSGTLSISMCEGTLYDSVLAVYGPSDADPANPADATCRCPADGTLPLSCNDDGCGVVQSPSVVTIPGVVEGACYIIRVGGWSSDGGEAGASRGESRLEIGALCQP